VSGRRITLLAVLAGVLVPAETHAATGDLSYVGCFGSTSAFGCVHAPPGVDAAVYPLKTAVAPDGANAYAIGADPTYFVGGLMRMSRAEDGSLAFRSCFVGPACASFPPWINPMDQPRDLVLSPDGRDLYVISTYTSAVAHFRLDAHGDPAFVDCIPCDPVPGVKDHNLFSRPMSLAISPDGANLYVGTFGHTLLTLAREADGSLSFAGCYGGSVECSALPGPCAVPLNESCRGAALDNPRGIGVSRDGRSVFVASGYDNEYWPNAVSRFRRAADGTLSFEGCLGYATAGCHSTVAWPIVGGQALAVGPSGDDVYVAAEAYSEGGSRDVISHLKVGTDGSLRIADCISQQAVSGCGRLPAGVDALHLTRSIVLTADGQSLYTGAVGSPGLTHFRIGTGGALTFGGCFGGEGCTPAGLPATGAQGVSASPDGRNVYGHAESMIVVFRREQSLAPLPAPPPPSAPAPTVRTGDANAIGQNAAILAARINPLGSETTYSFELGSTTEYGTTSAASPAGGGSDRRWLSTRVTGLAPGTTYHYRVVATSAAGTARGGDRTFTTEPRPDPVPDGLAPVSDAGPGDRSVAYQINVRHSGYIGDERLVPPLARRWSRELGIELSYPLIAEGKVFVVGVFATAPHRRLYALDADTGGTLWWRGFEVGSSSIPGPAYSGGVVFAAEGRIVGGDGIESVAAFDAATGEPIWAETLSQFPSSSLTAGGGVLYATGNGYGGDVFALRGSDGALLWSRSVLNGDESSPALLPDKLFVSYPCHVYGLARSTGAVAWHRDTGCSGGGGRTAVVAPRARLYVRDLVSNAGSIFDANTGDPLGTFSTDSTNDPPPAFAGRIGLHVHGGRLTAENLDSGATLWTFAGEGGFAAAPIVAGRTVYAGSRAGRLYGLDLTTGAVGWSADAGAGFLGSERPQQQTWSGLGAGNGLLVTPAGGRLVAWSPLYRGGTGGGGGGPTGGGGATGGSGATGTGGPPAGATAGGSVAGGSAPVEKGSATAGKGSAKKPACSPTRTSQGPVRVTAGIRDGVARLAGDALVRGRYAHSIGWVVSSRYRRSVTITARGLSFAGAERLRIRASGRRAPRRASGRLLLPGPGCYTFDVKGPGLRQRLTFAAR
jgi:outer membrane protein assembly factor BamB